MKIIIQKKYLALFFNTLSLIFSVCIFFHMIWLFFDESFCQMMLEGVALAVTFSICMATDPKFDLVDKNPKAKEEVNAEV